MTESGQMESWGVWKCRTFWAIEKGLAFNLKEILSGTCPEPLIREVKYIDLH